MVYFKYISMITCPYTDENSKIQSETKLKKSTVETLLNELFSLNDKDNEIKMEEYADKIGVKILYSKNCMLI